MKINDISYHIRGAIYDVYNELGPGLLESVYEHALMLEMRHRGLKVENQVEFDVLYKGTALGIKQRIDLMVDDLVLIELKSVESLLPVHFKQLIGYLKLTNKPLGFLVNFNTDCINDNIKRLANDKSNKELR
jgi:GxxExxY protein